MKLLLEGIDARHPSARVNSAPALRGLGLKVADGESLAVIGPSGAGKTTLLHVLACALPPAKGRVQMGDFDPWRLPRSELQRLRGELFLAPQVPPLPPRQRVVTSVLAARLPRQSLLRSLRSLLLPDDIPAAFDALERFDLADKLFERVDRLSGGERQRVGLARALLAPARLWLIDEPLSALDPARSELAIRTLCDCAAERNVTLVATLHQVDTALANFPRIVGLRDGALAFDLPSEQVTLDLLAQLYDQKEDELRGPAPAAQPLRRSTEAAAPAVMHCR
ncbi:MAG: ATP-binding cassette domain-containing protein [Rubrivivax sp.]